LAGRILELHEDGGVEALHFDEQAQTFAIEFRADVEPVIEANKANLRDGTGGWSPTREWRKVARIPVWVVQMWVVRYGVDPTAKGNDDLLKRLLNDPEWRWLRTAEGRL